MPTSSASKARRRASAGRGRASKESVVEGESSSVVTPDRPPTPAPPPPAFSPLARGLLSRRPLLCPVFEVDPRDGDFSSTLWMPEALMLSASLSASRIVSVSVPLLSTSSSPSPEIPQVQSLEWLCSKRCLFESPENITHEAGSFFVIAVVWPCRKLKDGIRLSRQLAYALGFPETGSHVYVSPITFEEGKHHLGHPRLLSSALEEVSALDCQELVLKCYPFEMCNLSDVKLGSSSGVQRTPEHHLQSTLESSFSTSGRGCESPISPNAPRERGKAVEKGEYGHLKGPFTLSSILESGSDKVAALLARFANRLLHGRYLLKRNFVSIPVCGQTCIFQVLDAKSSSEKELRESGKEVLSDLGDCMPTVLSAQKPRAYIVGSKTQIQLVTSDSEFTQLSRNEAAGGRRNEEGPGHAERPGYPGVSLEMLEFSGLGGLSKEIGTLKEIIKLSLLQPECLIRLGLQPPRGVLLHGPPGTGKTSLALASAKEAGVRIFMINGPEIVSEYYGESEAALRRVFEASRAAAPSVVFIDELDAIAPQRTEGGEDLGQRMVAALLTLMDGGGEYLQGVLVIAATNRVEAIDPALRRPGRFDRELKIGVPSPSGRLEILLALLQRMSHTLTLTEIETLAAATHGFVGADLKALCNEAAMSSLRHYVHTKHQRDVTFASFQEPHLCQTVEMVPTELSDVSSRLEQLTISPLNSPKTISDLGSERTEKPILRITMKDFEEANTRVRPSAMREVMLEVPKVRWSDIGGQEDVKQKLQEAVVWPQRHSEAFSRIGSHPPTGVLLYGPPGCSKTLMARAVATEGRLNFIAVKGPELFSKWVGESEKAVHALFERARAAAPSVVFFDELDGLAVKRGSGGGLSVGDRVISQLLIEMDGLSSRKGVTVIAATNRPDKIDSALLRPGRFDRLLYVGPPDEGARLQIFNIHTAKMPCGSDVDKRELARRTAGYTGADIASICRESAMAALEEDLKSQEVRMHHFNFALTIVKATISNVSVSFYAEFSRGLKLAS